MPAAYSLSVRANTNTVFSGRQGQKSTHVHTHTHTLTLYLMLKKTANALILCEGQEPAVACLGLSCLGMSFILPFIITSIVWCAVQNSFTVVAVNAKCETFFFCLDLSFSLPFSVWLLTFIGWDQGGLNYRLTMDQDFSSLQLLAEPEVQAPALPLCNWSPQKRRCTQTFGTLYWRESLSANHLALIRSPYHFSFFFTIFFISFLFTYRLQSAGVVFEQTLQGEIKRRRQRRKWLKQMGDDSGVPTG